MPFIVAAAITGVVAGLGSAAAIGTLLLGTVLSVGFSVATSFAISALTGRPKSSTLDGLNSQQESRQQVRQATPRKRLIYGSVTVSGAIVFLDKKPPWLVMALVVAAHRINRVMQVSINNKEVTIGPDGWAISTPYGDGVRHLLKVQVRDGAADQGPDAIVLELFPEVPTSFRHRGNAVVTFQANYGANLDEHTKLWGSSFNPLIKLEGKPVYDPRDPKQALDDDSTWIYSNNSALVIMDYLCHPDGGRRDRFSDVDWVLTAKAADICDVMQQRRDGTFERSYTIDGVVQTSEAPISVLKDMLGTMGGLLGWNTGRYYPIPACRADPVMTIHQRMLKGAFDYRDTQPRAGLFNVVSSEFLSADRNDQTCQTPVLERNDLILADGERLEASIRRPYTSSSAAAQRLDKMYLEQSRRGRALKLPCDLRACRLMEGDVVTVSLEDFAWLDGTYKVMQTEFDETISVVNVSLTEWHNAILDFDPVVDEREFVEVTTQSR